MSDRGALNHIDLSISDPDLAIPFYEALFLAPGYYAAFYADPDGIKIEIAHIPGWSP